MQGRMRFASILPIVCVIGCNQHPLKEVEYESHSGKRVTLSVDPQRDVDILFVIDNSGSMGEEQATLAGNFGAFIDVLEAEDVAANYRIAVTTTDNGHVHCAGTGAEAGNFVLSSCRQRLDQFVSQPGSAAPVDAQDVACLDLCPEALADLEAQPTTTDVDSQERARPWLERIDGRTNLPDGVEPTAAFACFGPQGVDGCGYEAPLESMYKALARAGDENEDEFGFLRTDALLAIVFVTDEADCSVRPGYDGVFDPDGDRALWTSDENYPTSGVCWNAGVTCETGDDGRLSCAPANVGVDGVEADEDDAVLQPLTRYVELLQGIEDRKRDATGNHELDVLVSVIAGVPSGGGDVEYGRGTDPDFEEAYGIAPGCSSENGEAVPPARLLELASTFAGDASNLYSVCDADYTPALEEIADRFRQEFEPACVSTCPRDIDRIEDGLQTDCVITETVPGGESYRVADCEQVGGEWQLPDGEDVCVYIATGEERDDRCENNGTPVEFRSLYRPGVPRRAGATLSANCSVSDNAAIDCPWE